MIKDFWRPIRLLLWPRDLLEVREPWLVTVDGFQTSSQDFYAKLEAEFQARAMPGVLIERLELQEAGLFSDQREYLCVARERYRFEVCAAPFGNTFFFSMRSLFVPPRINRFVLLLAVLAIGWVLAQAAAFYGLPLAVLVIVSGLIALIKTLRNVGRMGWDSVDAWLLKSWVIGGYYEMFFRPETFFRQDVRAVFLSLVEAIIKETAQATTLSKGVRIPLHVLRPPENVLLSGGAGDDGAPPG